MAETALAAASDAPAFDLPTVAGIAALVYVVSTLLHEGAGHGSACVAVGGRPIAWGAYYFVCDLRGLAPWAGRVVAAAGSAVNLAAALVCRAAWRRVPPAQGQLRFLLWLAFAVSAFQGAGYLLYSGVSGAGDWGQEGVLRGATSLAAWRLALTAVGAAAYFGWARPRAARLLEATVGGTSTAWRAARQTAVVAYATGGAVSVLVGLLNPLGMWIVLGSAAAASLGGTVGLLSIVRSSDPPGGPPGAGADAHAAGDPPPRPLAGVPRSGAWVVAGLAAALAYAALLGPSLRFRQ